MFNKKLTALCSILLIIPAMLIGCTSGKAEVNASSKGEIKTVYGLPCASLDGQYAVVAFEDKSKEESITESLFEVASSEDLNKVINDKDHKAIGYFLLDVENGFDIESSYDVEFQGHKYKCEILDSEVIEFDDNYFTAEGNNLGKIVKQ